jgi:hypothetical protein
LASGVEIRPGATQLAAMPNLANSQARERVKPISPALLAE